MLLANSVELGWAIRYCGGPSGADLQGLFQSPIRAQRERGSLTGVRGRL